MKGRLLNFIRQWLSRIARVLSGDIIVEKKLDRYLGFVFYVFVLTALFITWSLFVESRLVKVRENEARIHELQISCQQMELDLVSIDSRTKIDQMLSGYGSHLHAPVTPPARIVMKEK